MKLHNVCTSESLMKNMHIISSGWSCAAVCMQTSCTPAQCLEEPPGSARSPTDCSRSPETADTSLLLVWSLKRKKSNTGKSKT